MNPITTKNITDIVNASKTICNNFLLFDFSLSSKNQADDIKNIALPIAPAYWNIDNITFEIFVLD